MGDIRFSYLRPCGFRVLVYFNKVITDNIKFPFMRTWGYGFSLNENMWVMGFQYYGIWERGYRVFPFGT
jgi:hypothetical protein